MTRKRKLIWQIFPSFLFITLLAVSVVASYSSSYFRNFFLKNAEKDLTTQVLLLEQYFREIFLTPNDTSKNVDRLCKAIGTRTGTRFTIILPSGEVIGDSLGNIKEMENHIHRPEIVKALKLEKGLSTRYSATLDQKMMYVALPVSHDEKILAVVRAAVGISTIDSEINSVRNKILVVLVFVILSAAAASLFVSRRITRPIEQMKTGALKFSTGNLGIRMPVPASEELSELAVTMNRMASNLDEKIRDFKNRSMELEAIYSSMQEGVIAIDKSERIITVNDAAAQIFEFPEKNLKDRDILEVARNLEFQAFIQKALSTHFPVEEDIVISKDQDMILNIHSTALYDSVGKRIGTLIIFHDITRIRRLEQMHKDFAANASHELKTPLTTIKGFIETLQGKTDHRDEEQNRRFLQIIEKNVNRMVDLIDDLLALAKLERLKGTETIFELQALYPLIQSAVAGCHDAALEAGIKINVDCEEHLKISADPILLGQALINLIDNALKYSNTKDPISVKAFSESGWVQIQIQDNGNGIAAEHLPKIFNRFYRVDKARSRNEGGTGLGLAIVKHIVQYHGGRISVDSTIRKGTCFTIQMPE